MVGGCSCAQRVGSLLNRLTTRAMIWHVLSAGEGGPPWLQGFPEEWGDLGSGAGGTSKRN